MHPIGKRIDVILRNRPGFKNYADLTHQIGRKESEFRGFLDKPTLELFWRFAFLLQLTPEELSAIFSPPRTQPEKDVFLTGV